MEVAYLSSKIIHEYALIFEHTRRRPHTHVLRNLEEFRCMTYILHLILCQLIFYLNSILANLFINVSGIDQVFLLFYLIIFFKVLLYILMTQDIKRTS